MLVIISIIIFCESEVTINLTEDILPSIFSQLFTIYQLRHGGILSFLITQMYTVMRANLPSFSHFALKCLRSLMPLQNYFIFINCGHCVSYREFIYQNLSCDFDSFHTVIKLYTKIFQTKITGRPNLFINSSFCKINSEAGILVFV